MLSGKEAVPPVVFMCIELHVTYFCVRESCYHGYTIFW